MYRRPTPRRALHAKRGIRAASRLYACSEYHGVLLQLKEGGHVRFRCHTGHAYSVDSLLAEFGEKSEESLRSAIRALEEGVILMRQLARHYDEHRRRSDAETLLLKTRESRRHDDLVRQAVMRHEHLSKDKLKPPTEEAGRNRARKKR